MGSVVENNFVGQRIHAGEEVDRVRRPPILSHVADAYAVFVIGDSMEPLHPHGAVRAVHPHRPAAKGDTVVVYTTNHAADPGQVYIKTLLSQSGEEVALQQLNPPATIRIPRKYVTALHKVLSYDEMLTR